MRRLLALALLAGAAGLLGVYLRGRSHREPVAPVKPLGLEVRQSAEDFTVSKSTGDGKPVFRIHASRAVQLKTSGQAVLHNVQIDLYGADGSPADHIEGDEFQYDQQSSRVTGVGLVHIDMAGAKPAGSATNLAPDEPQNLVHIEAHNLDFDVKSGQGSILDRLTFRMERAQGSADQASFDTRNDTVYLHGSVSIRWDRDPLPPLQVSADACLLDRTREMVMLTGRASLQAGTQTLKADGINFVLAANDTLQQVLARGHVQATDHGNGRESDMRADEAVADFVEGTPRKFPLSPGLLDPSLLASGRPHGSNAAAAAQPAHSSVISKLELRGGVNMSQSGPQQSSRLEADNAFFDFDSGGELQDLQARGHARIHWQQPQRQGSVAGAAQAGAGEGSLAADTLDFQFQPGSAVDGEPSPRLAQVVTGGRTHVTVPNSRSGNGSGATELEADGVRLLLDPAQKPSEALASGAVMVRQTTPMGMRISNSDSARLSFRESDGGLRVATANGHVDQSEGERSVKADQMVYTADDGRTVYTSDSGSSFTRGRVSFIDSGTQLSAIRIVAVEAPGQTTVQIQATGGVNATLMPDTLRPQNSAANMPQSGRGMFQDGVPIAVLADALQIEAPASDAKAGGAGTTGSGKAVFTGKVRMWQGPDMLAADQVDLDRNATTLDATGNVCTTFVTSGQSLSQGATVVATSSSVPSSSTLPGNAPMMIRAAQFHYDDQTRQGTYERQVVMAGSGFTLTSDQLDVWLARTARVAGESGASTAAPARVERVTANGGVRISQPGRQATADTASYEVNQDRIQLKGGPPSIFDAENGFTSGEILTFSPHDKKMTVESHSGTRTFGQLKIPQ